MHVAIVATKTASGALRARKTKEARSESADEGRQGAKPEIRVGRKERSW